MHSGLGDRLVQQPTLHTTMTRANLCAPEREFQVCSQISAIPG